MARPPFLLKVHTGAFQEAQVGPVVKREEKLLILTLELRAQDISESSQSQVAPPAESPAICVLLLP